MYITVIFYIHLHYIS